MVFSRLEIMLAESFVLSKLWNLGVCAKILLETFEE
jgi:hypothetical protein